MIGHTIGGKYSIVRQLGEGGMGAVYEARHLGTGRRIAIKVITGELASDPKLVARFEIEARAAGAIESEHIAQVLDVGQDGAEGAPFLAMEYLDGEDVQQLLRRLGPLPADLALRIGVQACMGLEKAHAQGIVHRDIKPANLFLTACDGGELRVKVLDFGIAKVSSKVSPRERGQGATDEKRAPLTRVGMLLGSPLYMSPEQARGKGELDHRTDIWSLGIVLYQALTGRTPLDHVRSVGDFVAAVCTMPVTPIRTYAAWVDPAVAAAVERALALSASQRYPSATEMREALSVFLPQGSSIRASMLVSAATAGTVTAPPATVAATPMGPSGTAEMRSAPSAPSASSASSAPSTSSAPSANLAVVSADAQPFAATVAGQPAGVATPSTTLVAPQPAARPPVKGGSGPLLAGALAVLALGVVGGAVGLRMLGHKRPTPSVVVASLDTPKSAVPPPAALSALLGTWWGDGGQIYDATHGAGGVLFKLRDPEHLAAQGYVAGDPHFVLRALDGETDAFRVETRARPLPPKGFTYDLARAHATCVAPWVDVGGRPLRAELSGDRLLVKLARIDAGAATFTREGLRVVGCSGLADATALEADLMLSREPVPFPAASAARWGQVDAGAHDLGPPSDAGTSDPGGPADHLLPIAAPCQGDGQCRTHNCVVGRCTRVGGGRRGGPCLADEQCASRRCAGGLCR